MAQLTRVRTLDESIDRVYQSPLAEFVTARNQLASTLKREGRPEAGAQVRALAKPSLTAWVVNQLYWRAREDFDALVAAGDQLRGAERAMLEGRTVKKAADVQRVRVMALKQLLGRADDLCRADGIAFSPLLRRRLSMNLEAIAVYGTAGARHQRGRLTADLEPPGFDVLTALAPAVAPNTTPGPVSGRGAKQAPALLTVSVTEQRAQERLTEAAAEVERMRHALADARAAEHLADEALARAQATVDEARRRLEEATSAAAAAQGASERARAARATTSEALSQREEALKRLKP